MSSGHQTERVESEPPRQKTVFTDVETVLHGMQDIVGRKWHPVLLYYLLTEGPLSFSGFKRSVDKISSKMLSQSLSDLEESGLVTRTDVDDQHVRVEYRLTERGESLAHIVTEMVQWGSEHGRTDR